MPFKCTSCRKTVLAERQTHYLFESPSCLQAQINRGIDDVMEDRQNPMAVNPTTLRSTCNTCDELIDAISQTAASMMHGAHYGPQDYERTSGVELMAALHRINQHQHDAYNSGHKEYAMPERLDMSARCRECAQHIHTLRSRCRMLLNDSHRGQHPLDASDAAIRDTFEDIIRHTITIILGR